MKIFTLFVLVAAVVVAGAPIVGQMCPASSVTPFDPCPGASSSQCVAPTCPRGAMTVGPLRNRRFPASFIQAAINAAPAGVATTICVRPATYLVTSTLTFGGKPITLVAPAGAILQGNGLETVVTFDSNEGSGSGLNGFTITGGSAPTGNGGGILIQNASPSITNCTIKGNAAHITGSNPNPAGGGAYISGSEAAPTITCTTFLANTSDYEGGGLETAHLAHPFLNYSTITTNFAPYGAGFAASSNGSASIENCLLLDNLASVDGGGLHIGNLINAGVPQSLTSYGSIMIRRSEILDNAAAASGGGMWVAGGFATVVNDIFDNNSAPYGSAVGTGFGSTVNVESSIVVNNIGPTNHIPSTGTLASDPSANDGTTLLNNYNCFFNNLGPDQLNTVGNVGNIDTPPNYQGCYCLVAPSRYIANGMPDPLFNNGAAGADFNLRNDCGPHGGPTSN